MIPTKEVIALTPQTNEALTIEHDKNGCFTKGHNVPLSLREYLSKLHKGKHYSPETEYKKGRTSENKGKKLGPLPDEVRRKISKATTGTKNHFHGKHHTEESKIKMSNAHNGQVPWNTGKHRSKLTRQKIRESLKGREVSEVAKANMKKAENRTRFCVGSKHPNWKGGKSSLALRLRDCSKYNDWRFAVFSRDEFTCQICGQTKHLEAHHILPFAYLYDVNNIKTYIEGLMCSDLWDINNGITLCELCHDMQRGEKTCNLVMKK